MVSFVNCGQQMGAKAVLQALLLFRVAINNKIRAVLQHTAAVANWL